MSQSLFGMNDGIPQQTVDSYLRKWPVMVVKHVNYNIGDLTERPVPQKFYTWQNYLESNCNLLLRLNIFYF